MLIEHGAIQWVTTFTILSCGPLSSFAETPTPLLQSLGEKLIFKNKIKLEDLGVSDCMRWINHPIATKHIFPLCFYYLNRSGVEWVSGVSCSSGNVIQVKARAAGLKNSFLVACLWWWMAGSTLDPLQEKNTSFYVLRKEILFPTFFNRLPSGVLSVDQLLRCSCFRRLFFGHILKSSNLSPPLFPPGLMLFHLILSTILLFVLTVL